MLNDTVSFLCISLLCSVPFLTRALHTLHINTLVMCSWNIFIWYCNKLGLAKFSHNADNTSSTHLQIFHILRRKQHRSLCADPHANADVDAKRWLFYRNCIESFFQGGLPQNDDGFRWHFERFVCKLDIWHLLFDFWVVCLLECKWWRISNWDIWFVCAAFFAYILQVDPRNPCIGIRVLYEHLQYDVWHLKWCRFHTGINCTEALLMQTKFGSQVFTFFFFLWEKMKFVWWRDLWKAGRIAWVSTNHAELCLSERICQARAFKRCNFFSSHEW